jgi:hypothetical protein
MKSHTIELAPGYVTYENRLKPRWLSTVNRRLGRTAWLAASLLPATALIIAAVWAVSHPDWILFLQAGSWAFGFVFLGLALDAEKMHTAWLNVLSAASVFVLTWLSKGLGPDLLIIVTAIYAAWITAALFKRA